MRGEHHNHDSRNSSISRANLNGTSNNRDNRQWRRENDETVGQSNDYSRWNTAGPDGRHTERYTRSGNWRRDNYQIKAGFWNVNGLK